MIIKNKDMSSSNSEINYIKSYLIKQAENTCVSTVATTINSNDKVSFNFNTLSNTTTNKNIMKLFFHN